MELEGDKENYGFTKDMTSNVAMTATMVTSAIKSTSFCPSRLQYFRVSRFTALPY
ncbi:hypothetical protein SAMN00790413_03830 [Deinococcus hopiensis KR-140]|uniref:Uncharacterized protein n=1 Tax=Deinococcus hopiensis KR-140 TaxID=695939 RepID=A0A1W1UZQ5_9DEIO|nr:hypothetical protein SAMN00790413_03830 [Deinococcus hopiensis KR-140]